MENSQERAVSSGPQPGFLTKISDLISSPSEGFKEVVDHPDWVGPLAILAAISLLSIPVTLNQAQLMSREFPQIPAGAISPILIAVTALISSLIVWIARGGLFHWLGMLMGSEMTWSQSLSISGYLNIPTLISTLVSAAAIWTTRQNITLGLGMGLSLRETLTLRGGLLSQLNIFTFWYLFLSTIGLSRLWGTNKAKSGVVTVGLWLLVAAFQVWQVWNSGQALNRLGM